MEEKTIIKKNMTNHTNHHPVKKERRSRLEIAEANLKRAKLKLRIARMIEKALEEARK